MLDQILKNRASMELFVLALYKRCSAPGQQLIEQAFKVEPLPDRAELVPARLSREGKASV